MDAFQSTMRRIPFDEARRIAGEKRLVPVYVRGTDRGGGGIVRLAKDRRELDPRLERIEWPGFEAVLRERGLAIYESAGWLRIMRDPGARERRERLGRRGDPWTAGDLG